MVLKRETLGVLCCAGLLLPTRLLAAVPERITHTIQGDTETWMIEAPKVTQAITEYPQIRFRPGDRVRVTAAGCVKVGGWGKSSKRYLDPIGPKSDRLYHGMIIVPGAIGKLPASIENAVRILIAKGTTYTVGPLAYPHSTYLRLGYEDDDYGDNGYSGQDTGIQGQCTNAGNAVVVLTIVHGPSSAGLPFDLSPQTFDDNGIPLNPKWAWQLPPRPPFPDPGNFPDPIGQCDGYSEAGYCEGYPAHPQCTSQRTDEDIADLCRLKGDWPIEGKVNGRGHNNWAPATYVGTIYWDHHSDRIADDDYNFRLVPPEGAGLNARNSEGATGQKSMKIEFCAEETVNHFKTLWWDSLHTAVDEKKTDSMGFPKCAIVTGLLSLDCAHCCATELHPVWAMAIRVNDDPADETWTIFVRRWGNEGFCGCEQHYLDGLQGDEFVFRLPWREGASGVERLPSTVFQSRLGQASGPEMVWSAGDAVLVSFTLPVPQSGEGERINGELHLRWSGSPAAAQCEQTFPRPVHPIDPGVLGEAPAGRGRRRPRIEPTDVGLAKTEEEPEVLFSRLVAGMTPQQRATFEARFPRTPPTYDDASVQSRAAAARVATLPKATVRARIPRARNAPDPVGRALNQQRIDALRAIYGERIPKPPRRESETHP
jgi:hypothetical protein